MFDSTALKLDTRSPAPSTPSTMSANKFFDIALKLEMVALCGAIGYAAWKHVQIDPEFEGSETNEKIRDSNNSIKVAAGFLGLTALTIGVETAYDLLKRK